MSMRRVAGNLFAADGEVDGATVRAGCLVDSLAALPNGQTRFAAIKIGMK
jgi:hypothetical protein